MVAHVANQGFARLRYNSATSSCTAGQFGDVANNDLAIPAQPGNAGDMSSAQPPVSIVILAAGASARMRGGDKLLERIDGIAQILRVVQAAMATGAGVWVLLPPDRPDRNAQLTGLPVRLLTVCDAAEGMAASLRHAATSVPRNHAMLILPADLPEITSADLQAVLTAWQTAEPDHILRATAQDGTPGHPVIFPPGSRADLLALRGDHGARSVLRKWRAKVSHLALPDSHATTDLDTPEDWAEWRAKRGCKKQNGADTRPIL